jgi:hypothetical protein
MSGDFFDPHELENNSSLVFRQKSKKGEIGKIGRYKDKPVPEGSSVLLLENDVNPLKELIFLISENYSLIKSYHVEEMSISIEIGYSDQCNWEISQEEITKLTELKLGLSISCYLLDQKNNQSG